MTKPTPEQLALAEKLAMGEFTAEHIAQLIAEHVQSVRKTVIDEVWQAARKECNELKNECERAPGYCCGNCPLMILNTLTELLSQPPKEKN